MLKLSRLTDYAAVVMAQIARHSQASHAAAELAEAVQLPHPTVSKTLKMLVRAGLMATCGVADNWQRVSLAMRTLLESVTLAHLADTAPIKLPVQLPIQTISLSAASA